MSRASDVLYEVIDGRAVLVDPRGMELLTLNAVGTLVWEALAEPNDVAAIAAQLLPQFVDVSLDVLESDVRDFVTELRELGLVADAA